MAIRDSARVRIVEHNGVIVPEDAWTLNVEPLHVFEIEMARLREPLGTVGSAVVNDDGRLALADPLTGQVPILDGDSVVRASLVRDSVFLAVHDFSGTSPVGEWSVLGDEVFRSVRDGRIRNIPVSFGGERHTVVLGERVLSAYGGESEVREFGLDGSLVRILRWRPVAIDVPGEVRRAELERRVAENERRAEALPMLRIDGDPEDFFPFRSTLPEVAGLQTDGLGNLWVAVPSREVSAFETWIVFDEMFDPVAQIGIPEEMTMLSISDSIVVGRTKDRFDLETISVWRIEKHGDGVRDRERPPEDRRPESP